MLCKENVSKDYNILEYRGDFKYAFYFFFKFLYVVLGFFFLYDSV